MVFGVGLDAAFFVVPAESQVADVTIPWPGSALVTQPLVGGVGERVAVECGKHV